MYSTSWSRAAMPLLMQSASQAKRTQLAFFIAAALELNAYELRLGEALGIQSKLRFQASWSLCLSYGFCLSAEHFVGG